MPYSFKSKEKQVTQFIFDEMARRIHRCCILLANKCKELLNVEGAGVSPSGKLRYGANPSQPGESPHKQTGHLLRSVAWEVNRLIGRVGTNLRYGRMLELGTRLMKPRPWLKKALKMVIEQIRSILSAPMKP